MTKEFYVVETPDGKFRGTYFDEGTGDAVVPSGDYPCVVADPVSPSPYPEEGCATRYKTAEEARAMCHPGDRVTLIREITYATTWTRVSEVPPSNTKQTKNEDFPHTRE